MNKSEVIKEKVKLKFKNFKFIGKLAGSIADRMVTDKIFIERIASKLMIAIPEKLNETIGVVAEVDLVFQYESFMVVSVDILSADARKIIERKGGDEKLKTFDKFMSFVGGGDVVSIKKY